ncbi:MAG: hypothetical protein EA355_11735 [Rhodobacteraceae bacterium]|nr:MAG: hypothetical protein EA355_11735 [Paracoccaceae bacterium]
MTATTGTTADAAGEGGFDFRIALASGNIDITIDTTQGMSVNDLAAEIRASVQAEIDGNAALAGFTVSGDGAEVILTGNGFDNFTTSLQGNGTGAVVGGIGEQTATAVDAFSLAFDTEIVAGQGYQINVAGLDNPIIYQATATDTVATVASALAAAVNTAGAAIGVTARVGDPADPAADPTLVRVAYSGSDPANREISSASANESTANGGLFALEAIDVSTKEGAENALAAIEGLIQTAISAAAAFGSAQGRIQTQTEFVSKLMDGFTSGIGVLVDADMEAASARLQALQVQQQLGIQALSIANQSPQNILALFR